MKYIMLGILGTIPLILLMLYTIAFNRDDEHFISKVGFIGGAIIAVAVMIPLLTWFCSEWMVK